MVTVGPELPRNSSDPHLPHQQPSTNIYVIPTYIGKLRAVLGPVEPRGNKGLATEKFTGMKKDGAASISTDLRWDKQGYQREKQTPQCSSVAGQLHSNAGSQDRC